MTASRRLINLAGTLLVVIALAVGTMLTALPVYFESRDLNAQEQGVAASNQLLKAQIDSLRAKETELPELEKELVELHRQLPGIPQLDDAVQLVVKAADKTHASIGSVTFGDVAPFVARDATAFTEQLPQTATGVSKSEPPADGTAEGEAAGDQGSPDDADGPTADTVSTTNPADPATATELQFPVTINVTVTDQSTATRFLDELRAGPRLLQIDNVSGSVGEEGLSLTVTGLVFVSLNH